MTAIWKNLFDMDFCSGNLSYLDFTHVSYWIFLFVKIESKDFFSLSTIKLSVRNVQLVEHNHVEKNMVNGRPLKAKTTCLQWHLEQT